MSFVRLLLFMSMLFASEAGAGCISGDCQNGRGVYKWDSGNTYSGDYKNGVREGYGSYRYASGSQYIGDWKNGKRDGEGSFTFGEKTKWAGVKYVGGYKSGKKHGKGTLYEQNGDKYVGEWNSNEKHGNGTLYGSSGEKKYVGEWKNNEKHGEGVLYSSNGDKYVGLFKNGEKDGRGTYIYANGRAIDGVYRNHRFIEDKAVVVNDNKKYENQIAQLKAQLQSAQQSPSIPAVGVIEDGPRTALVIGNSNYRSAPLKNPANDAEDIAKVLERLKFDVTVVTDANRKQMGKAIDGFGRKLKKGGVGLFFFAGHGMQVDGHNYLMPVGDEPDSEEDIQYDAIDSGKVLAKMEAARNSLNIVMIDACRNNPFARSFRSSNRGLARVDAPTGSIIVYATAPGDVAADGVGRNSPFTKNLLPAIQKPNVQLLDAIRETRLGVMNDTNKGQVPWVSEATTKKFFFAGTK